MADEKLNVSPEENPQPSLFDAGPEGAPAQDAPTPEPPAPENIPEQAAVDAPVQDAPAGAPGEVSVSADQIEKLMAEQRAAGRAEVEKNEPPEPEQPPTPAPEDKAAGEKEPEKKGKAAKEKTPEPDKSKGRRGRKPKEEKAGPGEPGRTGARRGRPAKADKAATDKPPSPPRDILSQRAGFGEAPQQAFLRACGPAKISGVATPELLAVCALPYTWREYGRRGFLVLARFMWSGGWKNGGRCGRLNTNNAGGNCL